MHHAPFIAFHGFDAITGRYLGPVPGYLDPLESTEETAHYNPPAQAIAAAPSAPLAAHQAYRINAQQDGWDSVPDYSACLLWDMASAQPVAAPAFGEDLPPGTTLQQPPSAAAGETIHWDDDAASWTLRPAAPTPMHRWDGREWTLDEASRIELARQDAEQRLKTERSSLDAHIAPLQDAVDLDMATDTERQQLIELKRRRVLLARVPEQTGYPLTIAWPD